MKDEQIQQRKDQARVDKSNDMNGMIQIEVQPCVVDHMDVRLALLSGFPWYCT